MAPQPPDFLELDTASSHFIDPTRSTTFKKNSSTLKPKFTMAEVSKHDSPKDCWLIIDGKVYDVTKYVDYHPGGQLISTWAGRDATDVFVAYHENWARTKIKSFYIGDVSDYQVSEINTDFRRLVQQIEEAGLMKTSKMYYAIKVLIVATILATSLYLALAFDNFWIHMLSALLLFLFWHQCSFIAHDSLHNVIFRRQIPDHLFSLFFSNFAHGISGAWWKYTHNQHHVVPNEYERDPDIMHLPIFAMTERAFSNAGLSWLFKDIISHQHLYFLPIMFIARINLYVQTLHLLILGKVEKMPWQYWNLGRTVYLAEVFGIVFFWSWYTVLLLSLPPSHRLMYFMVSNMAMGILHLQIGLNHWAMPKFNIKEDYDQLQEFSKTQILTSRNINSDWRTHWFFGGLQFQMEHHLFPRMPRHNFEKAKVLVMDFCKRHNIPYSSENAWDALKAVYVNFKQVAGHVFE